MLGHASELIWYNPERYKDSIDNITEYRSSVFSLAGLQYLPTAMAM